jgi:hypothetical protein
MASSRVAYKFQLRKRFVEFLTCGSHVADAKDLYPQPIIKISLVLHEQTLGSLSVYDEAHTSATLRISLLPDDNQVGLHPFITADRRSLCGRIMQPLADVGLLRTWLLDYNSYCITSGKIQTRIL